MPKEACNLSKRQLRRRFKIAVNNNLEQVQKKVPEKSVVTSIVLLTTQPNNLIPESDEEHNNCDPSPLPIESDNAVNNNCDSLEFSDQLKQWSLRHLITQSAVTGLLKILKTHDCFKLLPSDSRTLLSTRRSFINREVNPGKYVHFGLTSGLQKYIAVSNFIGNSISVFVSVDGIPVSKSSKSEFWPILCAVNNLNFVFCVGIYHGSSKPLDHNEYLFDFVQEAKFLCENGIKFENRHIKFSIKGFICDAPARALITCTKYHSGFSSCNKCHQVGERYQNRQVFDNFISVRRDDATFGNLDDDHHRGNTILSELSVGLVSQIPYEYMHLVCLGVVRKVLTLWISGKPKYLKLSANETINISKNLENLRPFFCSDFNRRPRTLAELPRWKATEFRQFILYSCTVVLRKIPQPYLNHFMSLHCAIFILCSESLLQDFGKYADSLLKYFVKQFPRLYGKENLSYNVHGLLHVYDDVQNFGNLDAYSAFSFENYLGQIKKLVRSGNLPLSQVCRRLSEYEHAARIEKVRPANKLHTAGPLTFGVENPSYKIYVISHNVFKLNNSDKYAGLKDGSIICIDNFATCCISKKVHVVGRPFTKLCPLYHEPCDSTLLKIFKVSVPGRRSHWSLDNIDKKYLLLPQGVGFAAFPLIHS